MQGPSAIALRQGGQGGALKYKVGVQVVVQISTGGPTPPAWKKKTTLQEVFGDFGQVLEIHTQDDGTAIVEFEDKRDAEDAAKSMNGKKIAGAPVTVIIRQDGRSGGIIRGGGTDDRVTEMAVRYGLDATSTARLVSAFRDRSRRGCNLDVDIRQLGEHLSASNKPSALVCMKLADLRDGKPIGPCRYSKEQEEQRREAERKEKEQKEKEAKEQREKEAKASRETGGGANRDREGAKAEGRSEKRERSRDRRRSRSRSRRRSRDRRDRSRDRDRDRDRARDNSNGRDRSRDRSRR